MIENNTIDTNDHKIIVKDLSIGIGNRDILSHAEFQLQVGKHYVLVGRNGIGKSSMKAQLVTCLVRC